MNKVNFLYLPTTSPGANDVNVAANESEDLDLGSDKWMKDLARADLDQCDSIYASAKKKPESSGQTQGYRPDDIKYAVSCRLLDMVQMLEYANGLQEKSGLALGIRPNHLAEALASIRPIEQENRASIFQYFCRTRENFGAILNPERRSVQDLIERLNFQMALGPPPDVVRTVLSRTNFEAREKALADMPGALALTPFDRHFPAFNRRDRGLHEQSETKEKFH